jgi:hypothetical protein
MGPISLSWVPQGTFHHVGFVVASIQGSVHSFAASLAATWDNEIIHDPIQAVRVAFLQGKHASDPLVELVEPAGEEDLRFADAIHRMSRLDQTKRADWS